MNRIFAIIVTLCVMTPVFANQTGQTTPLAIIKEKVNSYYQKFKEVEHFSGLGVAVKLDQQPMATYFIGNTSRQAKSSPVTTNSLFQIGSITKSFTAVRILQLAAAGKLKLSDTVGQYLPQYKKWGQITIEQLLNMSSGLPNYSDTPSWNYQETQNIQRIWSPTELLQFVYPKKHFNPPIKKGYYYTNTGYLLAEMIIEKVTQQTFKNNLIQHILQPAQLTQTFYPVPKVSIENKKFLMHGYAYNQYDNPALLGHDMQLNNLSWGSSAGAIIATAPEIVNWVQDLFISNKLLTKQQKQQLMHLVSLKTGEFIQQTTAADPKGFGLGVVQAYSPKIGRFWYYEGETLGFRALYMYIPCNHIIIAATVNSATNGENDHLHQLLQNIYSGLLQQYPSHQCKS